MTNDLSRDFVSSLCQSLLASSWVAVSIYSKANTTRKQAPSRTFLVPREHPDWPRFSLYIHSA